MCTRHGLTKAAIALNVLLWNFQKEITCWLIHTLCQCMTIDQDTDNDTWSGTLLISSMTVSISIAFRGDFIISSLLANDKGTYRSVIIANIYHTALRLIFT